MIAGAMVGQGCPHRTCDAPWRARAWLASALVVLTALVVGARPATAQDAVPEIGLRIAFGGGKPRLWRGSLTISDGVFTKPQLLGLEPDEPGSMSLGSRAIQIRQPSQRSYDGLDVRVRAPLETTLKLRLVAADDPAHPRDFSFRLQDLLTGTHPADSETAGQLDSFGNRLVISRAPGDQLRVEFARDSLVFTPGEKFALRIVPNHAGVEAKAALHMRIVINSRLTGEERYRNEFGVVVGEDGALPPRDVEFLIPAGDDVYELDVSLTKKSFLDPLAGVNPLATTKPLVERRLQFIAIAREAPPVADAPKQELVDEFDPVNNNWTERVARLPLLKHMPRMKQGRLSHGSVTVRDHLGHRWTQLASDAWQAHPLSITHPGMPHVLEVEYPSDVPQTLGVSVLETNAVGVVAPLGVDSAVEVEPLAAGEKPAILRQRLIFWPRTKTPVLLLTSHQADQPAIYGRVRLSRFTGPLAARLGRPTPNERLLAAWLDKPLVPEMFSATEARDLATTRSLDDWRTFYEGSTRLTQYLSHVGYNSVVVPALCEGSTIYPSRLLQPTPKYDTGIYLTAGQDPVRKDALELLFRICDREGLTLVPSLQFDAPLPELEELLRAEPRQRVGLELVDHQGRTWLERNAPQGGLAPYYNPLDARVQRAMTNVARELTQRYGHHASFGGVVLQLSPRGYALLPHAGWGLDDQTFATFAAASGIADPGVGPERFAARARWCATTGREQWLAWRAAQMTKLYSGIAAAVDSAKPGAPLILAGADMLDSEALRQALRPTLQAKPAAEQLVRDGLLEIGIDPPALEKQRGITFIAPHPLLPASNAKSSDWDEATALQLQTQLPDRGTLLFREPVTRRLATFDAVSPFGRENTYTWLAAQVAPSGAANRRRWIECVARDEQSIILDGGWMLPRGQEDELADVLATLRSLPRDGGATATPASDTTQPIVVRTYAGDNRTTACVVNQTAWPVNLRLRVVADPRVSVSALGPELKPPPLTTAGAETTWTFELPAYGIASGVFDQQDVKIELVEVRLPLALEPALVDKLKEVRLRATALKSLQAMAGLPNAGFEEAASRDDEIEGWLFARGDDIDVTRAAEGYRESAGALKVTSRGPEVWVRSHPIAAPRTGRVAVWVRLRTPTPDRQPELRLAIEARRGRQTYYRYATVGATTAAPLADGWAPFVLQIDDLPREGLDEFRIGFDLMGAGEVWIDDIEVFDASFTDKEQFEISRRITAADYHLRTGSIAAAANVLDGYWPRFLLEHVESEAATVETPVAAPSSPATSEPAQREEPASNRQTKRGWFKWMPSLF